MKLMAEKSHLSVVDPCYVRVYANCSLFNLQAIFLAAIAVNLMNFSMCGGSEIPRVFNYQGRVVSAGIPFEGEGKFKFALVNTEGTVSYWRNDGGSGVEEPTTAVSLNVTKGLFSVRLGDVTSLNMAAIPEDVFQNTDLRLRIWFNDGVRGVQRLLPDQQLTASPFAIRSAQTNTVSVAPESDFYLRMMSVGELSDGSMNRVHAPHLLPVATRGSFQRSVFQPIPTSVKKITELSVRGTTTIVNASLTARIIRRANDGGDVVLTTVQKPTGLANTQTVSVGTDIVLDHINFSYFVEVVFLAGDSSLQMTTLHWIKMRVIQ
jgi:hypothetical protein